MIGKVKMRREWQTMKKSFEVRKNSHARERVVGGAMSSGSSQGIWLAIGYEPREHGGGLGRGTWKSVWETTALRVPG